MEQKNNIYIIAGGALVVGLLIGWCVRVNSYRPYGMMGNAYPTTQTRHMMPDGSMMGGDTDMSAMMNNMNVSLQGKTGDVFDQAFLAEMIVHHQGAIDMANLALTTAKHQEIKDLAIGIIKAQTTEIAQMKAWQKSWYNK